MSDNDQQKRMQLRRDLDRKVYARDEHHRRIRFVEIIGSLTLLIIATILIVAILSYKNTIKEIHENRHESNILTCAAIGALTVAGRDVVEKLHNPVVGEEAAKFYIETVRKTISKELGLQSGDQLVSPSGILNCKVFSEIVGDDK